jgi:hypothetical protein
MSDFETVKLKTNVPLEMTLRWVYWSDGKDWTDPDTKKVKKLPPRVLLRGQDKGGADIQTYQPIDLLTDLQKQGLVRPTGGKDNFGGDAYEVVGGSADITLEKAERDSGKGHIYSVEPTGGAPKPIEPPATAPDPSPPTQAPPADHMMGEVPDNRAAWAALQERYKRCVMIAYHVWHEQNGVDELPMETWQTGAHALFIEANKQRL